MVDEFGFEQPDQERGPDPQLARARNEVLAFFELNSSQVFYSRQVEVRFEDKYFHWITNRAIRELVEGGQIKSETVKLRSGGEVHLLWNRRFRYYRRSASRVIELVESYSSHEVAQLVGYQGEMLVIEAFARAHFDLIGRGMNSYGHRQWLLSSHDLDFVYEKDSFAYGVEVKNSLAYMREDELNLKVEMCDTLGVTPLFIVRMMPKTWFYRVQQRGGFVLMLKSQLYPLSHADLARAMRVELGLPVHAPAALWDSTVKRFTDWHDARVNSERDSHKEGGKSPAVE
jgi:hypothetical protein